MTQNLTRRDVLAGAAALQAATVSLGHRAAAEAYPSRVVKVLVGSPAGTVPDVLIRLVGDQLALALGQPVVVENRASPGGIIAMQTLVSSAPDGHTVALASMSQAVFNTYLFSKLPYDPFRDFEPVALLASNSFCIAVRADHPANSLGELIALAKSKSDSLLFGTAPAGSPPHVFALLLAHVTGIETTLVPYKSGPGALTGVIRGDVQMMVDSPAIIVPQVSAGAVKVLAVTGRRRDNSLPDVPTASEAGIPALQCETWFGLVAPSRTAAHIVARLNGEVSSILARADVHARLSALGFTPLSTTPDDFRKLIRDEHRRWGSIIRATGLKLD